MESTDRSRARSRMLFAATITYALLAAVAQMGVGTLPAATETGAELVAWFRATPNSIRLGVWTFTVALPVFAVLAALTRESLPSPHRDIFFLGATVYAASIAVWTWTWGGPCAARRPSRSGDRSHGTRRRLLLRARAHGRNDNHDGSGYHPGAARRRRAALARRARTHRLL